MVQPQDIATGAWYKLFSLGQKGSASKEMIDEIGNLLGIDINHSDDIQIGLRAFVDKNLQNTINVQVRFVGHKEDLPDLRDSYPDWVLVKSEMKA